MISACGAKKNSFNLVEKAVEAALSLRPDDYSDVGQGAVIYREYKGRLRYSTAGEWLYYDGMRWREDNISAQRLAQELTKRQLAEARALVLSSSEALLRSAETNDKELEQQAKSAKTNAERYHSFVLKERNTHRISAALTAAQPALDIKVDELDKDGFLLNTPAGTVDLRTGQIRAHNPNDFCTKLTGCAPSDDGADMFQAFLDSITCSDEDLKEYLQLLAGMFAVGAVYRECLVVAYGEGGNGKSTFFNLLSRVLGDYAGGIASDVLTANCRRNKGAEYAELRGKRLVVAAELEEGQRLDTATVKHLCSTDAIRAEKKFCPPFDFTPTHSLVLFTNHLPNVGTLDSGTWARLIVIPFNAKLRGKSGEVLNYAQELFEKAGGAVLSWVIEGAKKIYAANFKIDCPACVISAINGYKEDSDWVGHFLSEECEIAKSYTQGSGDLYQRYREYCSRVGDYPRKSPDFRRALMKKNFEQRKTSTGAIWYGLRLRHEYDAAPWNNRTVV